MSDTRGLDAAQFDELIQRAASERVCMQLEVERGRPKLRTVLAANVIVAALAGCASMDAIAPRLDPHVFVDSEPTTSGGSQITGFVIDEYGEAVPSAGVVLEGSNLSTPIEAMSDEFGMYGFSNVPPGEYVMVVYSGRGGTRTSVAVPERTHLQISFRGPYEPQPLFRGYVEIVTIGPGSFSEPGPYLADGG